MQIEIRNARPEDREEIIKLLSYYYLDAEGVDKNLKDFIVAIIDDPQSLDDKKQNKKIIGCACLDIQSNSLIELRSIAVHPTYRKRRIGSKMVDKLLKRALLYAEENNKSAEVYVRTTAPGFFKKKSFSILPREKKPHLWEDCTECDKFDYCLQQIMVLPLHDPTCKEK